MTARAGTYEEASAGILATMATYVRAVDDAQPERIVATFCPDGWVRLPGREAVHGHDGMRVLFSNMDSSGSARHMIANEHVTEWIGDTASAISDLAVLTRDDEDGWSVRTIGRYTDTFHRSEAGWLLHGRTLEHVT
jgi:ketosteroid isomerase-like protein